MLGLARAKLGFQDEGTTRDDNLAGANAVGLRAVHYQETPSLIRELEGMGIAIR